VPRNPSLSTHIVQLPVTNSSLNQTMPLLYLMTLAI
jgi:hypothetical protein